MSRTLTVVRKARKPHWCEVCRGRIAPGELYRDSRLPPWSDDVSNPRWWRLKSHVEGGCPAHA